MDIEFTTVELDLESVDTDTGDSFLSFPPNTASISLPPTVAYAPASPPTALPIPDTTPPTPAASPPTAAKAPPPAKDAKGKGAPAVDEDALKK